MKGTVPRPLWPAPADKTATHSRPAQTGGVNTADLGALTEPPIDASNQISLAVLEESSLTRVKGYDPYNKSAPGPRPADAWHRKRKRD